MKSVAFIILLILGWIFFGSIFDSSKSANSYSDDYDNEYAEDYCDERISEYQYSLEEANSEIERLNSDIEDAKWYAWESYDEMGEALDSLDTGYTVSEPY